MTFIDPILFHQLISSFCYIVIGVCLYMMIHHLLKKSIKKGNNHRKKATIVGLFTNVLKYVIAVIVLLLILEVFHVDTTTILASLGIVGLVIGLALQDLIKDFIAGIFIIFDNQYNVGDTVKINDFRGEVIAVGLKTTKIRAYTGEIKMISNGSITDVINYSIASSLAVVDFEVAYEENLDHVIKVVDKLCKNWNKNLEHLIGEVEIVGVMNLGNNGIQIRLTAETEPLKHFQVERTIRKELKDAFDQEKIVIPYQQVVVHHE